MYTFRSALLTLVASAGLAIANTSGDRQPPPALSVIPIPARMTVHGSVFRVRPDSRIAVVSPDSELAQVASYAANVLGAITGVPLRVVIGAGRAHDIHLSVKKDSAADRTEAYNLTVTPRGVRITSSGAPGVFYGIQTLRQLLTAGVPEKDASEREHWTSIPCVVIEDHPRFGYRGMHLDVGRHFFPVDSVKKYIDILAMHKMNRFHWHLTEDQGWRVEIKTYPLLTSVGAWRAVPDGSVYGGFYTQDEIRDVVRYARERYVEIIPEIEMPGHSLAALAAYPGLSCTGGPFDVGTRWGVYDDVFCAGNDRTFEFLQNVLSEICGLFPGRYVHIGGDEVPKTRWKECPRCQERIRAEGLKDESELQSYFITRIEKFLNSRGRRVIGWDEILEGGLAPEATVMSWRGIDGGLAAARQGHDAIMTPSTHCYFDYYQGNQALEPRAIGGFTTIRKVYTYEPIPPGLTAAEQKHILGAQGNVWTEYIETFERVQYMALPRLCALAEVLWSPEDRRSWEDFASRLPAHFSRLAAHRINSARSLFSVNAKALLDPAIPALDVHLECEYLRANLRYTLDGTEPTPESPEYVGPVRLASTSTLRAAAFEGKSCLSTPSTIHYRFSRATGKAVRLTPPHSAIYTAGGSLGLTNGVFGSRNLGDGNWQGFEGTDVEAVVDLGRSQEVSRIGVNFLQNSVSWVFLPAAVSFAVSSDGESYLHVAEFTNDTPLDTKEPFIKGLAKVCEPTWARYVRITARAIRVCPPWHPGAGKKAWLFLDEIQVD